VGAVWWRQVPVKPTRILRKKNHVPLDIASDARGHGTEAH
jgi:hypothetical protein